MKINQIAKSCLIFLLIFSMLLGTACGKKDTPDGEETTGVCAHTSTTLKNQKTATCKAEGYSGDRVCDACGETVETGSTLGKTDHTWDNGSVTKQPTCVDTGVKTVTCTTCFLTQSETIPTADCQTEHRFESDEIHKIVCAICYKSENGSHTQGEVIRTVAASCTEGAYTLYSCTDCKGEYKVYDETNPTAGHVWDTDNPVVTPATCSSEGSQYFVCMNADCDARTDPFVLEIARGAHDYRLADSVAATCTDEGYERYECRYCGDETEKALKKTAHTYGKAIVSGDWSYQTCTGCDHKISTFHAADKVSASISSDALQTDKALVVSMKNAAIEFPTEVVEQMTAESTVSVKADFVPSQVKDDLLAGNTMSDEDKAALSQDGAKIYDFSVTVGNQTLHEFGSRVTVTLPYTLGEGEETDGVVIFYVAADGTLTEIKGVRFLDEDGDGEGSVVFEVEHFSYYAVAYKETAEMRCRRGVHDLSNETMHQTVEATCSFPGYMSKTCQVCGHTVFDNYTAKKGHSFGEKQQPNVTCDEGGYVHQVCSGCGEIKKYEYIPATGHKLTSYATCESGAVCEICHHVVTPAYGHAWTEWETVVQPTAENTGLKRRHCPHCGEIETRTIAQMTDVSAWKFDSYQDLIETLASDALGFGNGTIVLGATSGSSSTTIEMTICEEGDSYVAEIRQLYDGEEEIVFYYRNGLIIGVEDGDSYVMDIDMVANAYPAFEETYAAVISTLGIYDQTLSSGVALFDKVLDAYLAAYEKELDQVLAARGSEYTAKKLGETVDSLKTVYTYLALKLGVATDLTIEEGVDLPTKQDWHRVLESLTEKTETAAGIRYTYNATKFNETVTAVLDWLDERNQKTLAEASYDLLGTAIVAYQPTLTNWDVCVSHVRSRYTGTTKFKTLIDRIVSFTENSKTCTVGDVYDAIGILIAAATGEQIDVESFASKYGDKTMDELARIMLGSDSATIAEFYDAIEEYMETTKLGEMIVGYGGSSDSSSGNTSNGTVIGGMVGSMDKVEVATRPATYAGTSNSYTLADAVKETRTQIKNMALAGSFEIVLDANGNLIDLSLNTTAKDPDGASSSSSSTTVMVKKDATARVQIPAHLESLSKTQLVAKYDQSGNLILSGLPSGLTYDLEIDGDVSIEIGKNVELDSQLTRELGYNVYMLKRALWNDSEYLEQFIQGPDGTLYEIGQAQTERAIRSKIALSSLMANPAAYLPTSADVAIGYCTDGNGRRCDVYETLVGYVFKTSGEWRFILEEESDYYYDGGRVYSRVSSVPFVSTFSDLQISNIDLRDINDYVYTENGTVLDAQGGTLYYTVGDYGRNVRMDVLILNDSIYLIGETDYGNTRYHIGARATDVPAYDRMQQNKYSYRTFYKDGKAVSGYSLVSLYRLLPSYYVEYDGYYFELTEEYSYGTYARQLPFVSPYVADMETHKLPDGRTVYVVGRTGNIEREGIIFGYIQVKGSLYAQAACRYSDGRLTEISYRRSATAYYDCASKYDSIDASVLVDSASCIKKNADGSYTVSADAIRILKENCRADYDIASVVVKGENADGTIQLEMSYTVALQMPEDLRDEYSARDFRWNDWFQSIGTATSHQFVLNTTSNGISITLNSGKVIDVEFEFDVDNLEAADVLTYDAVLSDKESLDIYTATKYSRYSQRLALVGNTYYNTTWATVVQSYEESTPETLLRQKSHIRDIYYRFDMVSNDAGISGRVYAARLWVPIDCDSSYSIEIHLMIRNGQIMVLSGVSEVSDVRIQFESLVTLEQYVASLSLVSTDDYETDCQLLNKTPLRKTEFEVYEGDYRIGYVNYYYVLNGSRKQYVFPTDVDERIVPNYDSSTTLPTGWIETSRQSETYDGRSYYIVNGIYYDTDTREYVRVGNAYVDLRDAYSEMYSEENAMQSMCESTYVCGVYERGEWAFYSSWEWDWNNDPDRVRLYDPVAVSDDDLVYREDWIGCTIDGKDVYYFIVYESESLDTYDLGGGVVMYCQEGTTYGYAKLQNGRYLWGELYEDENGYFYHLHWSYDDFNDGDFLTGALMLHRYVEIDGTTATISLDILSKLRPYGDDVTVRIVKYDDSYGETVESMSFGEFESLFR